ncbi:MAG: DUF1667 domain-containing protein [Candidatus Korarchaeota archaeon]
MSNEQEFICIVCPVGCLLKVKKEDNTLKVIGARCQKGIEHAKEEATAPKRLLFGFVVLENTDHPRVLPVRASGLIPKEKMIEASKNLANIKVKAPIKMGEVIIKNFLNLGVDIIATRDVDASK